MKFEILNSKQYRNSNVQNSKKYKAAPLWGNAYRFRALGFWSLEFVSDFHTGFVPCRFALPSQYGLESLSFARIKYGNIVRDKKPYGFF